MRTGGSSQDLDLLEFQLNPESGIQPQTLLEIIMKENGQLFSHVATTTTSPAAENPGGHFGGKPAKPASADGLSTTTARTTGASLPNLDGILPFLLGNREFS